MKQPYKLLLQSSGEVKCWWEPEPEKRYVPNKNNWDEVVDAEQEHEKDLAEWKSSFVTLRCAEGEFEKIKQEVCTAKQWDAKVFEFATPGGINITPFAEVKRVVGLKYKYPSQPLVFFRAPESVEEPENDEDLLLDIIGFYNEEKNKHDPMDSWPDKRNWIIKQLQSRYTIKRK